MTDQLAHKLITHNMFVDLGPGIAEDIESYVEIGPSFDPDSGGKTPVPYPKKFKAVWDTGAQGTTIVASIATLLGLNKTGEIRVQGVTGCGICNSYLVSIHLPNGIILPEIEVSDCPEDIGCDVLIGMDVITQGDFAISNLSGRTTFTFRVPSVERIDFTRQVFKQEKNRPQ